MTNYIQSFQKRYACKRMNNTKIGTDQLGRIIESIQLSPSSYGIQPYQVILIQNEALKKELQPLCNQQPHITECDTLIIFAAFTSVSTDYITNYIKAVSEKRNVPLEKLDAYKNLIIQKTSQAQADNTLTAWTAKQTYLALGFALAACALEGVDSCPIEGFDAQAVNAHLGLAEYGLHAAVLLAVGNRDVALDYNATLAKYRKSEADLLIWKK